MKTQPKTTHIVIRTVLAAALLFYAADAWAQSGTWTNLVAGDASGSWANTANWNNGVIADGVDNTADFSTLNITTNSTVTLDGARTIGNIVFGDTTPDSSWVLTNGSVASTITLNVSSGVPTITANSGSNIVFDVIAGTIGLTKAGAATLRLNGANTTLFNNISVNAGILQAGNASALGAASVANTLTRSNLVVVASGATLEIIGGIAPSLKPVNVIGTGVGGTKGAIYADLSGLAQANNSTRLSIGLITVTNPAVIMLGDTTITVDGTNNAFNAATMLIGHITTSNALTATPANFAYTLTKAGTGRLQIDPANGYTGGDIHVVGGSLKFGNNSDLVGSQTLTIDVGAGLFMGNISGMNSINSSLVLNGLLEMNGRGNGTPGSDTTVAADTIGYLSGSGVITNGSGGNTGAGTLTIAGTNGSSTTFSGIIAKTVNGSIGLRLQNTNSTLRLTGANTYAGATTVNAGTLLVNGSHTNGAAYTINPGGTLGGSGTIYPAITLNAGGTLMAGDGGGTLNLSGVTGAGSVVVSNANLTVSGQLNNSGSGNLNSLYLSNSVTTINLQGGSEASIYATTVNIDGPTNTLNVLIANPALGQFPLIGGISSLGGLNGFSGLNLQVPLGVGAYLSNNTSSIDIVVTNIPAIVWNGTPTGDWIIGGSSNWLNGATPAAYTETAGLGPFVVFDDTAVGTASVNLASNVNPRGITVNASVKTYTFSGTAGIGGSGNWVKDGPATLTVANSGVNNFSGSVSINGGTVQLGNGGAVGNLGTAPIINSGAGSLAFNRSDNVTFSNAISGNGALIKQGANTVILTGIGGGSGAVTVNSGTLAFAPAGTVTLSGDVTGGGTLGAVGAGTVILSGGTITYGGGTVITNGTLEFASTLPPSGTITDNGTLALGASGTLANNVSGTGGVSLLNSSAVTLGGANAYAGPTVVLGGSVTATDSTYPPNSVLVLGNQADDSSGGTAYFTAGNPALGGLKVAGTVSPSVNLGAGGQTLTINGNMSVGCLGPAGGSALLQPTGAGASIVVNTNGGVIQIGLGVTGSGVNPDNVFADLSGIDNFVVNLGATGLVNLGTLDGNPGPSAGATVVNWFNLASVSNSITAGAINIGAGGRQLVPELRLGAGTNVLNVNTLTAGSGGRDGSYLHFLGGTGGLRLRGNDGISRAAFAVGNNSGTATGASITNTVDFTGHPVDLLVSTLTIGNYNNAGIYQNSFSFDTGVLDASSTGLCLIRNNNGNAAASGSTLNINGGTASLGPVSLTASAANGTLNISNATVTMENITSPGAGLATLNITNSTLNLVLTNLGNPVTASIAVDSLTLDTAVNLNVNGTNWVVGQFPLFSYTGSIGGTGFSALNLTSLPSGVGGYLSNNVTALSVDMVITNAPALVNTNPTNITAVVNGGNLELSWPADHTGWHLQAQTNSLSSGLGTNWVTILNTQLDNKYTNAIDATKPTVFYRMVYP